VGEKVSRKLRILAGAAKDDASRSSSGSSELKADMAFYPAHDPGSSLRFVQNDEGGLA
jgi:predicted DNA-binding helix-hairpin-helix protein